MGGESIENVSGEVESNEIETGTDTTESTPEITKDEVASAFDETDSAESQSDIVHPEQEKDRKTEQEDTLITKTEINVAFDEKEDDGKNLVSGKEERLDYYSEKLEDKTNSENIEGRYDRPTGYRAGVRDQVWENAKDEHGRVRDPVSGRYMSKDQPWHMGHKPGYEFVKHQESAERRGISREEFLDEHNNPEHYRPELPKSNMSHKGESKTENYYD